MFDIQVDIPYSLKEEDVMNEKAERALTEANALKQITFPDMDSDGLPSSYVPKVLGCLGKWQLKMADLASKFKYSGDSSLKQLLVFQDPGSHGLSYNMFL